jgi:hypothetical protein
MGDSGIAARRFRCGSATRLSEADNGRPADPAAAGGFNARGRTVSWTARRPADL